MALQFRLRPELPRLDVEGAGAGVVGIEPACVLDGEQHGLGQIAATMRETRFNDETGSGRELAFCGRLDEPQVVAQWTVRLPDADPVLLLRLKLTNGGNGSLSLGALVPLCCLGKGAGWPLPGERLRTFCLGAHSWSEKGVSPLDEEFETEMVGAVADETGHGIVSGFVSYGQSPGHIGGRRCGAALKLEAASTFQYFALEPGESASSEWAYLHLGGDAFEGLEHWAGLAGRLNTAVFMDPPATGFYSWYYYCGHVTEEHILKNAQFLAANRDRFPVNYIHLDWGWQLGYSCGEYRPNDKFPHGLAWLAQRVRSLGFIPSIWMTAFMYDHPTAPAIVEQPELFQQNSDGTPHPFGEPIRNIMGRSFAAMEHTVSPGAQYHLDLTKDSALEFVTERYRRAREAGFGMVMLDFIGEGSPDPGSAQVAAPAMQPAAALRRGVQAARRGLGADVMILGCGTPYAPIVGIANMVRVGIDVPAHWASVCRGSRELLQQYFMHNRLWTNYTDSLCARGEQSPFWPGSAEHPMRLTLQEAQFYAAVTGLSGAAVMIAEDVSALSAERQWLLTLLLPAYQGGCFRPVDLFADAAPRLLELYLCEGGRQWTVAAGLNWAGESVSDALDLSAIGLAPGEPHHAFDVLAQRYLAVFEGTEVLGPAPAHGVKLVNLVPASGKPQVVGTDLHITQGAVEISSESWDEKRSELALGLKDLHGRRGRIAVWAPGEMALSAPDAAEAQPTADGGTVHFVEVRLDGPRQLALRFT